MTPISDAESRIMEALWRKEPLTSEEIVATDPSLSLPAVYAALAYYHDNHAYFDQKAREIEPLAEDARRYTAELKAKFSKGSRKRARSEAIVVIWPPALFG